MNELNPLLRHPILREVSYEMMKNPTIEGIIEELNKNDCLFVGLKMYISKREE